MEQEKGSDGGSESIMPEPVRISDEAIPPSELFIENTGLLFQIKPPQRRYKWKKLQVDQLWRDIRNAHLCDLNQSQGETCRGIG